MDGRPSVRVLQFVVRRLKDERVGLMTTARGARADDDPLGVVPALAGDRVHAVHVGPLSQDALERVLRARVGEGFSRTTLRDLHEMSGGNPFFAREIGLALLRRGEDVTADEGLPIPDRLQELIEDRFGGLPARTVEALEVVSSLSAPTFDVIAEAIATPHGVDDLLRPAINNEVVEVVGGRLRFTHPLLASAVYQRTPLVRRRQLHARLATIVRDPEERARHLALSVDGPDVAVAAALDEAAQLASSRGAPQSAAEFWEMARRTTPRDRVDDLVRRTHQAGVAHYECGDTSLARSVLEQAVDLSMAGPARARVLLDLGMGLAEVEGWRGAWAVFEAARGEAGDDLWLRALIEQNLGYAWLFKGRPRGIGTARSRSVAAGRGAAGPTGDGRGVPGVSVRRVPPRTRGRSGTARSRARPGGAHGGRVQVPCPACELRRGSAPQVHRPPGRGPPDVHRAPG